MSQKFKVLSVVAFIASLLVMDVALTTYNNAIIKRNKELLTQTAHIKIYYDQIGKVVIHALDLGLRGYALVQDEQIVKPMQNASHWKDSIFQNVEEPLRALAFPLNQFHILKDSIDAYVAYCFQLKSLIDQSEKEMFIEKFKQDKGATLWGQYLICENSITEFTNKINEEAEQKYEQALLRNIFLQLIIFFITVPTLWYTAKKTLGAFYLSHKLHISEAEKNRMLSEQNIRLEHEVAVRTQTLTAQNEEIRSQSEELSVHRDMLETEVQKRTKELLNSNIELIENNNQLKQFSFTIEHIIRAPLANILGLTNIIGLIEEHEKEFLFKKIQYSANELDQVIKDLSIILQITRHTGSFSTVDLNLTLDKVLSMLKNEIRNTNANIEYDLSVPIIYSNPSYIENILYNCISNALKFKDEKRNPKIIIKSIKQQDDILLSIADNGMGIDLTKHRDNMFGLFKRFHFHVEGRGLGLYLTRIQVIALGGRIEVQSEPGKGTVFNMYLK
jgi:signal transduction histidine kinase